jgi:hypothetical protein
MFSQLFIEVKTSMDSLCIIFTKTPRAQNLTLFQRKLSLFSFLLLIRVNEGANPNVNHTSSIALKVWIKGYAMGSDHCFQIR